MASLRKRCSGDARFSRCLGVWNFVVSPLRMLLLLPPMAVKSEEIALKTNVLAFASRPKAQARPRRPTSTCSSARTVSIGERKWTDVEPGTYSHIADPVSKRLRALLRHGHLPREEDGAIEFWRLKGCLRNEIENSQHWSGEMWKSRMGGCGGNRRRRPEEKISILY